MAQAPIWTIPFLIATPSSERASRDHFIFYSDSLHFSIRLLAGYGGLDGWPAGRPGPPEHKESLRKLPVPAWPTPMAAAHFFIGTPSQFHSHSLSGGRATLRAGSFFIATPVSFFIRLLAVQHYHTRPPPRQARDRPAQRIDVGRTAGLAG